MDKILNLSKKYLIHNRNAIKLNKEIEHVEKLIEYNKSEGKNKYYHLVRYENKEFGVIVTYGDNMKNNAQLLRFLGLKVISNFSYKKMIEWKNKGEGYFYNRKNSYTYGAWDVIENIKI